MGLFSSKPGGTAVGNFLRGLGSAIAPGILGTGANKIEAGNSVQNKYLPNWVPPAYTGGGLLGQLFGSPSNSSTIGGQINASGGFLPIITVLIAFFVGIKLFMSNPKKRFKRR